MAGSRKNLTFINYAYVIGAIFVVIGHSTPTGGSDAPIAIEHIRSFIYCFHMPLFFFVAGLLMKYTKSESRPPYLKFVKDKAIKFLTPFVIFTLLGFIPKNILANYTNDNVSLSLNYFIKVFLSPRDNVWGHFWFLPTLLIIYIFSYLLLNLDKHRIPMTIFVCFTALLAVFPIQIRWACLSDISEMLVFFCLGIMFGKAVTQKYRDVFKLVIAIPFFILAIVIFVLYINIFYARYGYSSYLYEAVKLIVGILMLYVAMYAAVMLSEHGNRFFNYLNGKTFTIYIISWPCQAFAEITLNRILGMPWYCVMAGMFIAGITIPLLVIKIYKLLNIKNKFLNYLIGLS